MTQRLGRWRQTFLLIGTLAAWSCLYPAHPAAVLAADPVVTGPETEGRFPALQVPKGFRAKLFACDPLIEYPSVIAKGPESGTLFVAHDYVTGLGVEIVRRDEIRLITDVDGDGYADESTLYAKGFNSIQGLTWLAGTVYVMHAPLLTSLTDTNGDGVADRRQDLLQGIGLPPEENSNRLHCANGVVAGHDGWLYLALGDRGCDVQRPEGDRLLFRDGGILRCRTDGRDLHVFSHGLRNIYDVALDEELNVFVRDNENDGGDYMIRVCHCFHGSDHGYPYLYYERPAEAMEPLADLGRGSSAGGTTYLETTFPEEYAGSLFFCEWRRAVVRYPKQRFGSSFAPLQETDFATGAPNDPYGFKPTDLVVDWDGSLLISDWCDGQRPQRGRGRIYRVSYADEGRTIEDPQDILRGAGPNELVKHLNSDRYCLRVASQQAIEKQQGSGAEVVRKALSGGRLNVFGRLHAIWILAHVLKRDAIDELFLLAEHDADARVRAQCVRALADLTDPVLVSHRLSAADSDESVCRRLARLGATADPRIRLEVMIALGRLHWAAAPQWLSENWSPSDPAMEHAAMQLLRRSQNWPAVLALLDKGPRPQTDAEPSLRTLAIRALAEQTHETVADGLRERIEREPVAERRREYLDLLARIHRQPAEWTYWGFRPAPRPADSVGWTPTERIAETFDQALRDTDSAVRAFAVRRMLREDIPIQRATLSDWLHRETEPDAIAAILEALAVRPSAEAREDLLSIIRSEARTDENRLAAFAQFTKGRDARLVGTLLELAAGLEHGAVLAAAVRELGEHSEADAGSLFVTCLESANDGVRAAAAEALVRHPVEAAAAHVTRLLDDRDIRVRRAAAELAGKLNVRRAVGPLLSAAQETDLSLQAASLHALAALREPAALPMAVQACDSPETQRAALACLAALGGAQHLSNVTKVAANSRSIDVLTACVRTLRTWQQDVPGTTTEWLDLERAVSAIQAASGVPLVWRVQAVSSPDAAAELALTMAAPAKQNQATLTAWQERFVAGTDNDVLLPTHEPTKLPTVYLAVTDLMVSESQDVEFLSSAEGAYQVLLNGRSVWHRQNPARYQPDSDRFSATLPLGVNRLLVSVTSDRFPSRFQLRFRHKSSQADHERLTQLALNRPGNTSRGREVFLNADKSQCIKCHRLGEQGGRIGPDLTEIGSRFSRIHLIESVLEPSRTVAPSYESIVVALNDGRTLSGVKVSENDQVLLLGDNQGKTHELLKTQIEERQVQDRSTMPDGLEKRMTDQEFVDLIGFLTDMVTREN